MKVWSAYNIFSSWAWLDTCGSLGQQNVLKLSLPIATVVESPKHADRN